MAMRGAPTNVRRHVAEPRDLPPVNMSYDEYDRNLTSPRYSSASYCTSILSLVGFRARRCRVLADAGKWRGGR